MVKHGRNGHQSSHGALARVELGEGFDHFRQAATHVAGGVGARVGPRLSSAMDRVGPGAGRARGAAVQGLAATAAAVTPLLAAARTGAAGAGWQAGRQMVGRQMVGRQMVGRRGRKKKRSMMSGRRRALMSLFAVGIAAGAAGVVAARRRSRGQWEEYESGAVGAAEERAQGVLDSTRSAMDMAAGKANGAGMPTGATDRNPGASPGSLAS